MGLLGALVVGAAGAFVPGLLVWVPLLLEDPQAARPAVEARATPKPRASLAKCMRSGLAFTASLYGRRRERVHYATRCDRRHPWPGASVARQTLLWSIDLL